jgi:hypothetical protein
MKNKLGPIQPPCVGSINKTTNTQARLEIKVPMAVKNKKRGKDMPKIILIFRHFGKLRLPGFKPLAQTLTNNYGFAHEYIS